MRRFCARPSTVSFEATGAKGPRDTARRMVGSTPFSNVGATTSLLVFAQDKGNNWVRIMVNHLNANALGEQRKQYRTKQENFAEWKSNWESKARGAKMKEKGGKVVLGKVRGDGYAFVEGTVEKFRGTFTGLLFDKSGWRTYIEMETRGRGDEAFKDEIKEFFKRLKFKKIK